MQPGFLYVEVHYTVSAEVSLVGTEVIPYYFELFASVGWRLQQLTPAWPQDFSQKSLNEFTAGDLVSVHVPAGCSLAA